MANPKRARRPQPKADTTSALALAGLDEIVAEVERRGRLNSAQQDQLDFLNQFRAPATISNQVRTMARQMRQGIEGWAVDQKMFARASQNKSTEITKRSRAIGPDGRMAVLNRPVDHRRITDTIRRDMLRFPAIVMALAARISPVVGSFSSWAPECSDPIQRAVIKAQLEGPLHKLVSDALQHALSYGFAPFELVWENGHDLELEVVEGDDEDLVLSDPVLQLAKIDGAKPSKKPPTDTAIGGAAPDPEFVPPPKIKKRTVIFPGATLLTKAKDLNPSKTDILVQGKLNEFAGLRYDNDREQELDPLQSFVVTHDGAFGQLYGNSALDNVYGPFYVVEVVTQLCNMYLERKGDPPYKGFAPLVASHDENGKIIHGYTVMVDGINTLRGSGGFVMPSDTDEKGMRKYGLETMDEDPRVDIFVRWIEHMIRMMLWGLLVPDGAVWQSSRVGSFAASQTYADLAINLREIDLRGIESYLNRYIVGRILAMNFASPKRAVIQAKTRPDVKVAMLEKVLLKAMDVKTAPGQLLAGMIDWPNLLKQAGFPTM